MEARTENNMYQKVRQGAAWAIAFALQLPVCQSAFSSICPPPAPPQQAFTKVLKRDVSAVQAVAELQTLLAVARQADEYRSVCSEALGHEVDSAQEIEAELKVLATEAHEAHDFHQA